jgi:hypothetical protein
MKSAPIINSSTKHHQQIIKRQTPYLSSQKTHAEYIQGLPLHVLCTHVHNALQAKASAHRSCRHTVLACPSLSNDTFLSNPLGQQSWGNGIVDLVSAGVIEILPLEINQRPLPVTLVMLS